MTVISQSFRSIYDGYDVVATDYVYTSSAENEADDGWESLRADQKVLTIGVATLTATTLSVRIEGRFSSQRPFEISATNYTSITSIDAVIPISETCNEVRIGVKVDSTGAVAASPNNIYCGLGLTELK